MHHRRFRAFLPVGLVLILAAVVASSAAAGRSPRATLAGSVPSWATSANFKGSTSGSDYVGFRVYLGWRGDAAATARAVSTPGSSTYGQYLSPAQFRQQFAPSQADVNAVKSWLTGQGFTVDYSPSNNLYVVAEGTVAEAASAFGVSFGEYSVNGLTLRSPRSNISVPSSLAGTVDAVIGLDQSSALVHTDHVISDGASPGFRNARPCSAYWGEQQTKAKDVPAFEGQQLYYAPCGYVSAQLRGAYGLTGAGDGSGSTVAIIDAYASPTILRDANEYSSRHHLPQFTGHQFSQVVAPGTYRHPESYAQDPEGWYGEETLDVEAVHSMAPGANIVYVGAPNNYQDLDAALNHVVNNGLARIVTNSYGWSGESLPPGYIKPYESILQQAAAEGIGVYFSSGDSGDESLFLSSPQPDYPASSPWVTAVGGTSLGVGADNQRIFETYWGTHKYSLADNGKWKDAGWLYGGGGGVSHVFDAPLYQSSVASGGRTVPDVSMVGDPNTGFLTGQTQSFSDGTYYDEYRIGGTSLASPLFAGLMAVADQAAGHPHGFVNPELYKAGSGAFNDVFASSADPLGDVRVDYANSENADGGLLTSVRTFGETLTLNSVPGYDDATGFGTPNASFIPAIN